MQRTAVRHRHGRVRLVLIGIVASSLVWSALPAGAASKPDSRTVIAPAPKNADDRIAMPRRKLPPTITARRALGATYVDRLTVAFDVRIGKESIGRLTGLVDLSTGGADLRFLAPDQNGKILDDPFTVRIRGERMQIGLPADLRTQSGADGYVTTIREGAYGGVGVGDEVLVPIAFLTALPLPLTVPSWSAAPAGKPKSSAASTTKAAKQPTATPAPSSLRGIAERSDFTVLSKDRFGATAEVELRLTASAKVRELTIRFSPLKTKEAKDLQPVTLIGTVTPSAKDLTPTAPTGNYLTASKFFDLDPLPEDLDVPAQPDNGIAVDQA